MPRPSRTVLLAGAGGLAAVALLATGASYAFADEGVPRGVRVAGADLGGLSEQQAERALTDALAERVAGPVRLTAADRQLSLDPAAAGLAVDVAATVDEAASAGPVDRLRALVGADREVEPVTDVDGVRLRAALRAVTAPVGRPPREGSVGFQGREPVPVLPEEGRQVPVDQAADAVSAGWLDGGPVALPVETTPVRTTAEDVAAAVRDVAEPAVAAPIALDVGGDEALVVPPRAVARALTVEADAEGALVPRLDGPRLRKALGDRVDGVGRPPRDASFRIRRGKPVVVPSRAGTSVTPDALREAVQGVLTAPAPRRAEVVLGETAPELTTAEAEDLGIRERLASYTTEHPCCAPRVTNIQTMADLVDGSVVLPGETYSLNGRVGARDTARGFVAAPQILNGQFVDGVGGGVSQFATTMYNATFFAGMEDVEHKPHSYWITRYPQGREATVSTPAPDLKWRNDSPHGVLVTTSYTGTSITVTLWGTERYDEVEALSSGRSNVKGFGVEYVDRPDCTSSLGMVGFDITITRLMKDDGEVVARSRASHRYLPEPRFICGPPPAPSPTPSASPTPEDGPEPEDSPSPGASPKASPRPSPTKD